MAWFCAIRKAAVYAALSAVLLCTSAAQVCSAQASLAPEESALLEVRAALEHARFHEAKRRAGALLSRSDLSARARNVALELAAIAAIAARDERAAQRSLATLWARDPAHPRNVLDTGPHVERAFARARERAKEPLEARLSLEQTIDAHGRLSLRVRIEQGLDAIDSVHAIAWYPDLTDPLELVVYPALREQLTFTLPPPAPATREVAIALEARSPGGYVLGRVGDAERPVRLTLAPPPPPPEPPPRVEPSPLRRAWWLWTGVSIVAAGIAISAGVVAQ